MRLTKAEHLTLICETLKEVEFSPQLRQAFIDTGMLGPVPNWCSFYSRVDTWKDGCSTRGPDCPQLSSGYLDALFCPLNLAKPVASPLVLSLESLGPLQKKWDHMVKKTLHFEDEPATSEFVLLSFIPHWIKGAMQSYHSWKTKGVVVDTNHLVGFLFFFVFLGFKLTCSQALRSTTVAKPPCDLSLKHAELKKSLSSLVDSKTRISSASASRASVMNRIVFLALQEGYKVKGGFVRDTLCHGQPAGDIDINSLIESTEVLYLTFEALCRRIEADLPFLEKRSLPFRNSYLCSVCYWPKDTPTWLVEVQFIAGNLPDFLISSPFLFSLNFSQICTGQNPRLHPCADLTCNNLQIFWDWGQRKVELEAAGPWAPDLDLPKALDLTLKKEFGVQSGRIVPKVRVRKELLVLLGWTKVDVQEIPSERLQWTESEKYVKGRAMVPTDLLPLSWGEETAELLVRIKRFVILRQEEEQKQMVRKRTKEKWAKHGPPCLAAEAFLADGQESKILKAGWQGLLYCHFPDLYPKGNNVKEVYKQKYMDAVESGRVPCDAWKTDQVPEPSEMENSSEGGNTDDDEEEHQDCPSTPPLDYPSTPPLDFLV